MNICVYGAASDLIDRVYIKDGEELGMAMAKGGHTLVFGGGGAGMMGATVRGINKFGGKSIGVVPKFFTDEGFPVDGVVFGKCSEMIECPSMHERKKVLRDKADLFIVTAGGIGTYDEFFEILTLKKIGQLKKEIIILNTNGYYDHMIKMLERTLNEKFMDQKVIDSFKVFDTVEETMEYINCIKE